TACVVTAQRAVQAQPSRKAWVIGILHSGTGPRSDSIATVRQGLRELGYVEGQTVVLEVRFAAGRSEVFPGLVKDLLEQQVYMFVAIGPAALRAARDATSTIPIVAIDLESDPVQAGFIHNLAQPGGNVTGCFLDLPDLAGKWLELIQDVTPGVARVAVLVDVT